jgi:hypothetical protein
MSATHKRSGTGGLNWRSTRSGAGGVLFSTPHYDGYGAMLVRLSEIAMDDLADYLETSYRVKAPPSLRRILDS